MLLVFFFLNKRDKWLDMRHRSSGASLGYTESSTINDDPINVKCVHCHLILSMFCSLRCPPAAWLSEQNYNKNFLSMTFYSPHYSRWQREQSYHLDLDMEVQKMRSRLQFFNDLQRWFTKAISEINMVRGSRGTHHWDCHVYKTSDAFHHFVLHTHNYQLHPGITTHTLQYHINLTKIKCEKWKFFNSLAIKGVIHKATIHLLRLRCLLPSIWSLYGLSLVSCWTHSTRRYNTITIWLRSVTPFGNPKQLIYRQWVSTV